MSLRNVGVGWKILGVVGAVWLVMALVQGFVQLQLTRVSGVVREQSVSLERQNTVTSVAANVRRMRLHLVELAVTLLNEHETAARSERDEAEKRLAELERFDPRLAATLRARIPLYFDLLLRATDAYADDN